MRILPQPLANWSAEWASQNNRLLQLELQRIDNIDVRLQTAETTLSGDLEAITALTGTGILARTADDTWALRPITGTANEVTLTNGDGVSGAPTVSLPSALTFTGKTVTGGTFSAPTITGTWTASGATCSNLGTVTTADINGGSIDGAAIGASTPSTGAFTTLSCTGNATLGDSVSDSHTINGQTNTNRAVVVRGAVATLASSSVGIDYSGGIARLFSLGSDASTVGPIRILTFSSNASVQGARLDITATGMDVTGTFSCTGNATIGDATSDSHTINGVFKSSTYTVATLPTGSAGMRAFVTDANATTFASVVAGGGSNGVPVYHDGTNWRIG